MNHAEICRECELREKVQTAETKRRFGTLNPADLCRECELPSKTRELEEAGDRMAKRLCLIINSERTPDNASIDAVKNWWKAKEESK